MFSLIIGLTKIDSRIITLISTQLSFILCIRLWCCFDSFNPEPFQHIRGFTLNWPALASRSFDFGIDGLSLWRIRLTN